MSALLVVVLIVLVLLVLVAAAVSVYEARIVQSLRPQPVEEAPAPVVVVTEDPTAWIQAVLRKRIVLHTKDNQSIEGSLSDTMEDGLVLRAASLLNAEGPATPMAGEVFVPRGNVAFAQLDE